MTRTQAKNFIRDLVKMRGSVIDDIALDAPAVYPSWKEDTEYTTGQRVLYNEVLYKVLQDHTSQATWTPDVSASLFAKVLVSDDGTILPWEQPDSTNYYKKGDKVTHNGYTWVSIIDVNTYEPGVYGWEQV